MNKYNVIDTYTNEPIIQMANASTVAKEIGIPSGKVSCYAKRNVRWQGRYEIIIVESTKQPGIADVKVGTQWGREWDRVRQDPYIWHTIDDTLIGSYAPVKPNPYFRGKRTVARDKIVIEFTPRKGVKVG